MNSILRLPQTRLFPRRVTGLQQGLQSLKTWSPIARVSRYPRPKCKPFTLSHANMSASGFQYAYIEDVERLEYYHPGGYHPISIDDRLHDRYRILHKLGHGSYSTVWLALDEKASSTYVAIKVCTASAEGTEINILSELGTAGTIYEGISSMIPVILDRFALDWPNGTPSCLVTAPARCSLREAREASNRYLFQLDVARSMAAQLTMAVAYAHSRGYAHGDIHLGNTFLQLPSSLNRLTIRELYENFDAPDPQPVIPLRPKDSTVGDPGSPPADSPALPAGVPSHAIPPIWLGKPSHEVTLDEANITLSDFGVAFRPSDKSRFKSYAPLVLRPPEALFDPTTPLSFGADIWSLACVIFELFAHRPLIDGMLATQDWINAQQVQLQGLPPAEWWVKWDPESRSEWFHDDGTPCCEESSIWSWERRFETWVQEPRRDYKMEVIKEGEKEALLEMLQGMMAWRPEDRPSAKEVLETKWVREWGFPAWQEGRIQIEKRGN